MPTISHACGIIIENNKLLLTRRSLTDSSEPGKWCPINETVEKGENLEDSTIRGAMEEVGLTMYELVEFTPTIFHDEETVVYIGKRTGEIKFDPKEVEEIGWFLFDDAKKLEYAYGYDKLIEDLHRTGYF